MISDSTVQALLYAVSHPYSLVLLIEKDFGHAKKLFATLDKFFAVHQSCRYINRTDFNIGLTNGTKIRVKSQDKPDQLHGYNPHCLVVDGRVHIEDARLALSNLY